MNSIEPKGFEVKHLKKGKTRTIAKEIRNFILRNVPQASSGGNTTFQNPQEWQNKGEKYGIHSDLVVIHDGGDMAAFCNSDYGQYGKMEKLANFLNEKGFFIEECTSWYSAVYPLDINSYRLLWCVK